MTEKTIPMKLTWYGHSAFRIEMGAAKILIDPYLSDNPSWKRGWEEPAEGVTALSLPICNVGMRRISLSMPVTTRPDRWERSR